MICATLAGPGALIEAGYHLMVCWFEWLGPCPLKSLPRESKRFLHPVSGVQRSWNGEVL